MSNFPRVAKEQGRKFCEEVVKPAKSKRFVVRECHVQNSGETIYTIEDTVLGLPFRYCFKTQEAAEEQCANFNAKRRKPNKRSERKEQE